MKDIVVIGAGVIGLALGRELALSGARVTVLDRDPTPRGATWAAGGMLAPLGEARSPGAFLSLGLDSLARWPSWIAALRSEAGDDAGYRACGKLLVGATDSEVAELRERWSWQVAEGHDTHWVEGPGLRSLEARLAPRWTAGLHLPGHASVDPRRLHALLLRAAARAGAALHFGVSADRLLHLGGRVTGVSSTDGREWSADVVVVAAGAWSGKLAGLPRRLPIRPIRGQMLALRVERPIVGGLVAGPGAYLIPRDGPDGPLVVVGASMDDAGFTVATDNYTIDGLRRAAEALAPALQGARETARWAGLRPATPDELPILGLDPDTPGLAYATGHHRNGILLAPATAAKVASAVLADPTDVAGDRPFSAARFG